MKKEKTIKGFKGFNKDLTCNDFQYKEGETFEMDGTPERCGRGFHFCTEPLDILRYYNPANSVFHYVEGFGEGSTDNDDSKIAVSKIKIGAKISIADFVKLSFEAILKRCKDNKTSNSGYRSMASTVGLYSKAETLIDNSIACAVGYKNQVKGSLNSWIVCAEWDMDAKNILCVKSVKVDGKKILADAWYEIVNGKFVKA